MNGDGVITPHCTRPNQAQLRPRMQPINYKQLWPMGGDLWAMAKPTVLVSNVMICVLLLSKNKMECEITAFKLYTTYIIHE